MVGRAHGHRVDLVAELLEHLAIIEVLFRIGILLAHLVEYVAVDIAEGHDLAALAGIVGIAVALAANADARKPNLFVGLGWRIERTRDGGSASHEKRSRSGQRRLFQELTTVHGEKLQIMR